MMITFSMGEESLIKAILRIYVKDPNPCVRCSIDKKTCCGCSKQHSWHHKYSDIFEEFDKLKDENPTIDFDQIVDTYLKKVHAEETLRVAHQNFENALNELEELQKKINNPTLFQLNKVFVVEE